jgi:stage V sporulation protein G
MRNLGFVSSGMDAGVPRIAPKFEIRVAGIGAPPYVPARLELQSKGTVASEAPFDLTWSVVRPERSRPVHKESRMDITEINVTLHSGGKLRAFVEITIDGWLAVHGIKVIEGTNRTFVAMPTRENGGRQVDICHPTNQESRRKFEEIILAKYYEELHRNNGDQPPGMNGYGPHP